MEMNHPLIGYRTFPGEPLAWRNIQPNCDSLRSEHSLYFGSGLLEPIAYGSFVRFPSIPSQPWIPIIGRLFNVTADRFFFQMFLPASLLIGAMKEMLAPLDQRISTSEIVELVQTMQVKCIRRDPIIGLDISLAFVFTIPNILTNYTHCTGMMNVFYCRYRYHDGVIEDTTLTNLPFFLPVNPSDTEDGFDIDGLCYHSKIWKWICVVQHTLQEVIALLSVHPTASMKIPLCGMFWRYIKKEMTPTVAVTSRRRTCGGVVTRTQALLFESDEQVSLFSKVFGKHYTTKSLPRANYIAPVDTEDDFREVALCGQYRTLSFGMSFDQHELTVTVRQFSEKKDEGAMDYQCSPSLKVVNVDDRDGKDAHRVLVENVSIGYQFHDPLKGLFLVVHQVTDTEVHCKIVAPLYRHEIISYHDIQSVGRMIMEYSTKI
jgi:hypothetical protein